MILSSPVKKQKPGSDASTEDILPRKRRTRIGSLGFSNNMNDRVTVAESVSHFCATNKNSSVSQIMRFLISEEHKVVYNLTMADVTELDRDAGGAPQ